MTEGRDGNYLDILLGPIRVCAKYRPKFGLGHGQSVQSLKDFQELYRNDPFYSWFGLDNPMMYAAHKAAGGMTSIYRQIGIGCERLFRRVLQDELSLGDEQTKWSYSVREPGRKRRTLKLDARISLVQVEDPDKRRRIARWMRLAAEDVGVNTRVRAALRGVVFEVRQGYKSKDSKRQNADLANAATAYAQAYLPCALLLSSQIDEDILSRYRASHWVILTGRLGEAPAHRSTYEFLKEVVGYDLASFLERHAALLRTEVDRVLRSLLGTE